MENLVEVQKQLEIDSVEKGIKRYHEAIKGRSPADLTPERRYIQRGMDTLVPAIEQIQRDWMEGASIKGSKMWGKYICIVSAEKQALTALSVLFNFALSENTYTFVAQQVGSGLDQVRYFEHIRREDNAYFYKAIGKKMTESRWRLMKSNFSGKNLAKIPQRDVIAWGAKILELALEHTDMFEYQKFVKRDQYVTRIVLKTEIRNSIEAGHEEQSLLLPAYVPMVVPPTPWTSESDGGYLFLRGTAIKPVVGLRNDRITEFRKPYIGPVLDTLNRLHQTEWTIDRENFDLLKYLVYSGGGRAGIPETLPKDLPPPPPDFEDNRDARRIWLAERARIHAFNSTLEGQRALVKSQIDIGQTLLNTGASKFYYVWEADFRMRVYPKSVQLSPQSCDSGRGCLLFAQGVPLGEHGRKWLAIGLANAMGYDKVDFDKRVAYVESRRDDIRRWVEDPKRYTGWMSIDEPFQGLQIARDWIRSEGDPTGYVSHVAIGLDGSCNGMQHFSALARDPSGALYTNLSPTSEPQSLYREVAAAVNEQVERDCRVLPRFDEKGVLNPCFAWRGKVSKDIVKTPTMTTPYGVTAFGVVDQVYDALAGTQMEGKGNQNVFYMQNAIDSGLRESVAAACEIMDWLREVAIVATRLNKAIVWFNPDNVPIVQEYPNFAQCRIHTAFHKMTWKNPDKRDKKNPMSRHKNANSISPNFVHSLDAAHMARVIREANAVGITQFRMIHDSFGVHAGHCEAFHPILRNSFVDLHKTNWLLRFKEDVEKAIGTTLPNPPEQGAFDLEKTREALFAFH